jgi:hypothetical protein
VAGVEGAGSLDQAALCEYLIANPNETHIGTIDIDPAHQNSYGDLTVEKQIQDGQWVVVYPEDKALPGATPQL